MVWLLETRGANPVVVKEKLQETQTTRGISSFPELAALARSSRALPAEQEAVALTGLLVHSFFLSFFFVPFFLSFLPSTITDPI
jgi:hypothetical protein